MCGVYKRGFTLIEILVAMAILAVMAAILVPTFSSKGPEQERMLFIAQLNELVQLAWQNALVTNKLHRLLFDFEKRTITLEQDTGQKDHTGQMKCEPVVSAYLATHLIWPEHIHIKNFIIEGFDEMTRRVDRQAGTAWFYVVPDGMTQQVTINLIDYSKTQVNVRPAKIGLVLNPFSAQFIAYDDFK